MVDFICLVLVQEFEKLIKFIHLEQDLEKLVELINLGQDILVQLYYLNWKVLSHLSHGMVRWKVPYCLEVSDKVNLFGTP